MLKHLLTVETDAEGEQIFLHGSPEGLRFLATRLEAIAAAAEVGGQAHDHLMTQDWGGNELSSELQGGKENHRLLHHVVVYGWSNR